MIGTLLEKLLISVGVDLSDFDDEIDDADRRVDRFRHNSERNFGRIGESFKKLGGGMMKTGAVMTAGITAPLAIFGKNAAQAAIDAEEMNSAFDVVFGEMSDEVRAWAETTGDAMGRSTQELQRGALAFQELFGKALDNDAASKVSRDFALLTQDLASLKNLSNEVAQQKLFSGLTGEAEPLRAVGVFLNQAAVEAKALEMGLEKVGGRFTDQDLILARAAVIREQLAQADGDVMRTSESTANQIRASQAAYEELSVTVGTALIPAITPLIEVLASILEGFNTLDPGTQTAIIGFAGFAAVLGPIITVVGGLVTGIGFLITALGGIPMILSAVGLAINALFLSPLGLVVLAIAAVVAAFVYWDEIVAVVKKVGAIISDWWAKNVKPTFDKFVAGVVGPITAVKSLYDGVKKWLQDRLASVFNWLGNKLKEVGGYFFDLYDAVVGNSYIPDMVTRIGEEMAKLQSLMVDPAKKATKSVEDAFRTLAERGEGLLARLFPVQMQIRAIMEDLRTLDKLRDAGLISEETRRAGRTVLLQERERITTPPVNVSQGKLDVPELEPFIVELQEIPKVASDAQLALEDFGFRMGNAINNALIGVLEGRDFFDSLKRSFFAALSDIATSALADLNTAIFGKDGLGGVLDSFFSGILGGNRSAGGPVVAGRAYNVGLGEKFIPSMTGRVLSRTDAMSAAGGGREVVVVEVDKSDLFDVKVRRMADASTRAGINSYDRVVADRVQSQAKRRA